MESFEALSTFNTKKYGEDIKALVDGTEVLWRSVSTFRHACDLNVLYIIGILPTSPYHCGPILSESNPIIKQLAQCNRNMMFTVSSEPCQKGHNILDGQEYEVKNASVELWIRNHNVEILTSTLGSQGDRFQIDRIDHCKFSNNAGKALQSHDDFTSGFFITDNNIETNEMYSILVDISAKFTEFPSV